MRKEKREMNAQIELYQKQYTADSSKIRELESSQEAIEATARSVYLMKKEKEDIFITIDLDSIVTEE